MRQQVQDHHTYVMLYGVMIKFGGFYKDSLHDNMVQYTTCKK